jgi:hypothetical protein
MRSSESQWGGETVLLPGRAAYPVVTPRITGLLWPPGRCAWTSCRRVRRSHPLDRVGWPGTGGGRSTPDLFGTLELRLQDPVLRNHHRDTRLVVVDAPTI